MAQAQPTGPVLSQETANVYNKMKQDYAQIFKVYIELEDEKKEHYLVHEAIKDLESTRRCWRLIGGVLVERNVGEVMPSIKGNMEMIDKTLVSYADSLKQKEKELLEFELKHGIKTEKNAGKSGSSESNFSEGKKVTGVLA